MYNGIGDPFDVYNDVAFKFYRASQFYDLKSFLPFNGKKMKNCVMPDWLILATLLKKETLKYHIFRSILRLLTYLRLFQSQGRISKASKSDCFPIPITATAILISANLVSCMLVEFGTEASMFMHAPHHVFLFLRLLRWLSGGNILNRVYLFCNTELASFKAALPL